MSNKTKNILFGVAGIIVGLLFATMFGGLNMGGVYSNVTQDFSEGVSVDGTVVIDGSGNVDAPITSTTGTFSGTLGVTGDATFDTTTMFVDVSTNRVGVGTTTPLNTLHIEDSTATSTITVSSGSASSGGRIILEDTDAAGCSEISILDGTIIVETVTCPAGI